MSGIIRKGRRKYLKKFRRWRESNPHLLAFAAGVLPLNYVGPNQFTAFSTTLVLSKFKPAIEYKNYKIKKKTNPLTFS